jgi:steroid delta-isomerase-like uncharacterized protein
MKGEVREAVARAVVREYVSAWNSHDIPRFAALFIEDGAYGDFGEGKIFLGREQIGRHLSALFSAIPDLTLTLTAEPVHDGERALCKWTMSGTQTGPILGLDATGRTFQVEGSTLFMLKGGRMERAGAYYDVNSVVRQLNGLSREAAADPPLSLASGFVWPAEFPVDEDNIGYGE